MKVFGLIGYPLSHSFSARYFSDKFLQEGIRNCEYRNYPIPDINQLPSLIESEPFLSGLNITIPYKEQVLKFLTSVNHIVKETGACNCIRIDDKRTLHGYNTDVLGFEQTLLQKIQPHHTDALILGSGGASKAVAYVLKKLGVRFTFVSRIPKPGFSISYEEAYNRMHKCFLLINTTPVGMFPAISEKPAINYNAIGSNHYLYDLIYNPDKTAFLAEGEKRGAIIENGRKMLTIQAEEAWKIWNADSYK
ncbi:MAG TPA: shikimate dehydrogenase [Flavitalea sp.]|nr:shikimate dehydrogenase [Flavitalea sp.]